MYGRMYSVVIGGTASPAAAFDLFEFNAAAGKPLRLRRLRIAQTSEPTTEEEQLVVAIIRSHGTSGSGGGTPTPAPVYSSTSAAAGFTAETMNTTVATGGTPITIVQDAWNTRAGLDMAFAPEEAPGITGGGRLVVTCPVAPADAVTIRATAWVEEMG